MTHMALDVGGAALPAGAVLPSKGTAGAPGTDIEVTPAMIEAGVEAMALWNFGDPDEWKVPHIFRTMEQARREGLKAAQMIAAPLDSVG